LLYVVISTKTPVLKNQHIMYSQGAPRPKKFSATFFLAMLCTATIFFSCKVKNKWIEVDPAFSKYIDAYTSGVISKTASIKIQLADDAVTSHTVGEAVDESLFDFSPSVKGKAVWADAKTIEFKPDHNLNPDQEYRVSFDLSKITHVPSQFSNFQFNVKTLKPSFKINQFGLRSVGSKNAMVFLGSIQTADIESSDDVEKLLSAAQNGKSLKINWQHNESSKEHNFTIEDISRSNAASQVNLNWDGKPIQSAVTGNNQIPIPSKGDFKVLNVMAVNADEQYASVQFSDPLAIGQELKGLITITNATTTTTTDESESTTTDQPDITYTINGSEVKVYLDSKLDGNYKVTVNPGIRNAWGDTLKKPFVAHIFFENRLPAVKIEGKGNILPNSGKLILPFETIGLNAVDVSIIKIYENNVPQFLQSNSLSGDDDLRRVATPIVEKTIRLDDDKTLDLHHTQHFALDIDKYLKTEPGAIYHVTIGFRPQYSLYKCNAADAKKNGDATATSDDEEEDDDTYSSNQSNVDDQEAFWSRYNQYYPYGYNWDDQSNPCANSYYSRDRWATRNIIASDIGLVAKRTNNNSLTVAVASILTTQPMSGVELDVMDYQEQLITKAKSDGDGFANINFSRKPYLLIAKKGTERGYLKLDDESALSTSQFDVSGTEVKDGIKGFVFGERGVWRPGDTLYINCIIEDKDNKLPVGHPVEFSLYNPQGQLYKHIVQPNADGGFNIFKTATEQGSPTGNWQVKIKVGGAVFTKTVKIETIMPNRLKIDLSFGRDSILGRNNVSQGLLSSKWLFGATAKQLKAKIDVSVYSQKTTFPKYKDYTFDNPIATFSSQDKNIFDGTLDDNGNANINPDFEIGENAPGMLRANMLVKVFEPGGAFSVDNIVFPYSPYNSYAGVKLPQGDKDWGYLLTDQPHSAQIVDVDDRGNLVAGNSNVEVQLYKIQWRWWWDNSGEDMSNFTQDQYNKLITKQTVHLVNGVGKWDFNIPAKDWGRYLVLVKDLRSGHVTGQVTYMDDYGWESRQNTDDPTSASMLSFTADKVSYNVGDEITLTIPSSAGGRGLVNIESGTKILKSFWVETQQGQTLVKFQADKNMSPNIYADVTLLQPHAQTANDLPIRLYGVLPILVEDKSTILTPVITMPDVLRPEQRSSVTVSEASGRGMTYCIAIVDEGLLSLTHFKTPDPHSSFYAREALGVKGWDMYDYVLGAWSGGIVQTLTLGGDEDAGPLNQKHANRFKPVVLYMGPFYLKKGEHQTHDFTLPPYIGEVRTMVVAADNGSYGNADKDVEVKKPLMILATAPRVLGPMETIKVPVTVFAADNSVKNVTVSLQSNAYMDVVGAASQNITFSSPGEQVVNFSVKVKSNVGIGDIKVSATSGSENATTEIQLDIRNPNPPVTSVTEKDLTAGQQWKTTVTPIGSAATSKAVIEISSVPPMNLEKRLNYLIEYPYGCIEQTTSAVFPQLVLNQLTDLDDYRKAEIDRNIRAGISSLQDFQRPDGGFSYWPGQPESDEWGTNYAGDFLLEARDKGYTVSATMLQQWTAYQKNKANEWIPQSSNFYGGDLTEAYRLYLLAMAKAPEIGAMNRLKDFTYISPEAKWRLAAAYKLIGQDNVALALINGLPTTFPARYSPGYTYGSDLRDEAMVLETLTLLGRRDQAAAVLTTVASKLAQDDWYSTQTTAYSLIAIAKYCGKNPSGAKIIADIDINGKTTNINSSSYITQVPLDVTKGNVDINVDDKGSNLLYVRLVSQGQPLANDNLKVNNNPAILGLTVSYITQDGKPLDVTKLPQGTDFVAKVTITNPGRRGYYSDMALSQIFPSGWEILNTRMQDDGDAEGSLKSSSYDYQDVRDDRVYTYFGIAERQTLTYYVQLNAAYLGKYFLPGTFCGAMYDNTINAGINGRWIEVVNQ
jgi:alpha-2-macroglobulin